MSLTIKKGDMSLVNARSAKTGNTLNPSPTQSIYSVSQTRNKVKLECTYVLKVWVKFVLQFSFGDGRCWAEKVIRLDWQKRC